MTTATTRPMTCEELDPIAREAARALAPADIGGQGDGSDPELGEEILQRVREHLRDCPACVRRLKVERQLDARLVALAEVEEAAPPPALELRLTQAFRTRLSTPDPARTGGTSTHARRTSESADIADPSELPRERNHARVRSTRSHAPWMAGVVAIAAAAAAATVWVGHRPVDSTRAIGGRPPAPPALVEERPALPVGDPGGLEPAAVSVDAVVVRGAGSPAREQAAAFVPLGWDTSVRPIEIGRITRVRMPTSIAARFGWPLLPDAPEARVAADVLVGEDGTARALRFLPATYTPVSHSKE